MAILLGDNPITEKIVEVKENEVKSYNDKMAEFANEYLFSSNEDVLKRYMLKSQFATSTKF